MSLFGWMRTEIGGSPGSARRRRWRLAGASASVALVVGTGTGVVLAASGGDAAASVARGNGATPSIVQTVVRGLVWPTGEPPFGQLMTFGAGSTWVLGGHGGNRLIGLASSDGRLLTSIAIPVPKTVRGEGLTFAAGHVWIALSRLAERGWTLIEVSPLSDRVVSVAQVDDGPSGPLTTGRVPLLLASVADRLYIEGTNRTWAVVNALTGTVVPVHNGDLTRPVFAQINGSDEKIQLAGQVAAAAARGEIADVTTEGGRVWATSTGPFLSGFELRSYNLRSGIPGKAVWKEVWLVSSGKGELWGIEHALSPDSPFYLVRIDPSARAMYTTIRLGKMSGPSTNPSVAIASGAVWVLEPSRDVVLRVALRP